MIKQRKQSLPRSFACTECHKSFTQQAHLSIHLRKHTGERPYICHYEGCLKSFTQLGNLKTHERKHTGERPFKCNFPGCEKSFSQMGNMKTHQQLHLGIRPFPCTECSKSFTQFGNLKSHQLKVHSAGSEKFALIPQANLPPRKRNIPGFFSRSSDLTDVSVDTDLQFGLKEALDGLTTIAADDLGSTPGSDEKEVLESSLSNDTLEDGLNDLEKKLLMGMKAVISKNSI